MNADLVTFRAIFPEFVTIADDTVNVWLNDATDTLSQTAWGDCYGHAVLYYTAHNLALSQNRAADAVVDGSSVRTQATAGVITSASDGRLSTSFADSSANGSQRDKWFSKTEYGQAYIAKRRECLHGSRISKARFQVPVPTDGFFGLN